MTKLNNTVELPPVTEARFYFNCPRAELEPRIVSLQASLLASGCDTLVQWIVDWNSGYAYYTPKNAKMAGACDRWVPLDTAAPAVPAD